METLYYFVGRFVVWAVGTFLLGAGCWAAWHHRPRNPLTRRLGNALTWARVFLLGKRWHLSLEGARLLLTAYQPKKHLDSWERDIIAASLKYSHRIGWKDPYA